MPKPAWGAGLPPLAFRRRAPGAVDLGVEARALGHPQFADPARRAQERQPIVVSQTTLLRRLKADSA